MFCSVSSKELTDSVKEINNLKESLLAQPNAQINLEILKRIDEIDKKVNLLIEKDTLKSKQLKNSKKYANKSIICK